MPFQLKSDFPWEPQAYPFTVLTLSLRHIEARPRTFFEYVLMPTILSH